ncbi:MAG TPA: ribosome silencing factor [bacterium]|nr:ribosome silencing factor [bacterium]
MNTARPQAMPAPEWERVLHIVGAAQETKAQDIVVYDMEQRSAITDYVLICSGRSQGHVRGIAEKIETALKQVGVRCGSMEGHQEGSWVLLDYDVVIVHVFHPETRGYYDLESLLAGFPSQRFAAPAFAPDDAPPAA